MSKICIDAAQKSLAILQRMSTDDRLSSVTAFDSTSILRAIIVFILAYTHTTRPIYRAHIETLMALVKTMQQIGFAKMVAEETPGRLVDVGVFDPPRQMQMKVDGQPSSPVHIDDETIVQMWRNYDPYVTATATINQSNQQTNIALWLILFVRTETSRRLFNCSRVST